MAEKAYLFVRLQMVLFYQEGYHGSINITDRMNELCTWFSNSMVTVQYIGHCIMSTDALDRLKLSQVCVVL